MEACQSTLTLWKGHIKLWNHMMFVLRMPLRLSLSLCCINYFTPHVSARGKVIDCVFLSSQRSPVLKMWTYFIQPSNCSNFFKALKRYLCFLQLAQYAMETLQIQHFEFSHSQNLTVAFYYSNGGYHGSFSLV